MLQAHPIAPQMARKISTSLFAQNPPNLSAPCDEPCAVVRRRGQGRPSAGARVLALTEASTMADWRRRRQWSCSRIALEHDPGARASTPSVTRRTTRFDLITNVRGP